MYYLYLFRNHKVIILDVGNCGNSGMLTVMYESNLRLYCLIYFLSILSPFNYFGEYICIYNLYRQLILLDMIMCKISELFKNILICCIACDKKLKKLFNI